MAGELEKYIMDYRTAVRTLHADFGFRHWDWPPHRIRRGGRQVICDYLGNNGYNYGAEIGVRDGAFSEALCKVNKNINLLCIDPWTPYRYGGNQEQQDVHYDNAVKCLGKYNTTIIRQDSQDAAKDIEPGSLDFVYIDGLHDFDNVIMDLIQWGRRVKRGGIISGHDYLPGFRQGVVEAVDAYTKTHNITRWYVTRDRITSYFWVNP